jgi:hypothetical protein
MTSRIPAGKHRARPFRFGLWWNRSHFSWVVKFDESCRYDLGNEDQFDVNKLVGIGYLWNHHKNSARFGWRYWTERKEIELTAYCYVNGRRVIQHICFCEIGKEYALQLKVLSSSYYFAVSEKKHVDFVGTAWIDITHSKKLQYRLGCFFGGNQVAPHEMKIELKKL